MRKTLRIAAAVLAACLAMSACGQGSPESAPAKETAQAKNPETAAQEEKGAEEADAAGEATADAEAPAGASMAGAKGQSSEEPAWDGVNRVLSLGRESRYIDTEDTAFICYGNYDRITADDSHPALRSALEKYNDDLYLQAQIYLDNYKRNVAELGASGDIDADGFYHTAHNAQLMRADEHILSFIRWDVEYGLGNGNTTLLGVNFDPQTGEMLTLSDVVADRDALCDVVVEKVKELVPREDFPKTPEALVRELFAAEDSVSTKEFSWAAGYQGMSFLFNTTVNFAYFSRPGGAMEIFVPYREYPELFSDFCTDVPEQYACDFILSDGTAGDIWIDADGDGTLEEMVGILDENEYGSYKGLTLMRGQESWEFPFEYECYYAFGTVAHLGEGKDFLCLEQMEDDYGWNLVYRLNQTPEYMGEFDGDVEFTSYAVNIDDYEDYDDIAGKDRRAYMFTDPSNLVLRHPTLLLGSGSLMRTWRLGDAGLPGALEYGYAYTSVRVMTAKKKMTADEVNDAGDVIGTVDIPKGTKLTLLWTDNESLVDMKTPEGKRCRFTVTSGEEEYQQYIGDELTDDLFDGIIYAN